MYRLTVHFSYGTWVYSYGTHEEANTADRDFRNQGAVSIQWSTPKGRAWADSIRKKHDRMARRL